MQRVIHFEINADQPERAARFYHKAFGWQIHKDRERDYWMLRTGTSNRRGIDGAVMQRMAQGVSTVDVIDVPSLDESAAKIKELGGECFLPSTTVAGVGYTTYCRDTEGNLFRLLEPNRRAQ